MVATDVTEKLLMVGPDPEGLGGISRVAKIWQHSGLFDEYHVTYISSSTDRQVNKLVFLIRALAQFVCLLVKGCRMIYIHTSSSNSFRRKSVFIFLAALFRARILLHIHPTHFYHYLSEADGFERVVIARLLGRAAGFVVLTEKMQKRIKALFGEKPVFILPNAIDLQEMHNNGKYRRQINRLLYLGWYVREKGIYELVDAVEILLRKGIDLQLDFFGTKQIEKLRNYVLNKNLNSAIKVNGWIDSEKKIEALHSSTMLILPSHSEGIPNVILEAMATKTPIIATHVGGLQEILEDGRNAVIAETKNALDLSEKILKCLEDKDLREKISANAYNDAVSKYDIRVIKAEFAKIISQMSSRVR